MWEGEKEASRKALSLGLACWEIGVAFAGEGRRWEGPRFDWLSVWCLTGVQVEVNWAGKCTAREGVWSGNHTGLVGVQGISSAECRRKGRERSQVCRLDPISQHGGKGGTTEGGREKELETGESPGERGALSPCAGRSVPRRKR